MRTHCLFIARQILKIYTFLHGRQLFIYYTGLFFPLRLIYYCPMASRQPIHSLKIQGSLIFSQFFKHYFCVEELKLLKPRSLFILYVLVTFILRSTFLCTFDRNLLYYKFPIYCVYWLSFRTLIPYLHLITFSQTYI